MHQPSKKIPTSIEMTVDTQAIPPSEEASNPEHTAIQKACEQLRRRRSRQGGFVRNGLDGARYHLMETVTGIQALQVFTAVGQLAPVYINQQFFDSLLNDRLA